MRGRSRASLVVLGLIAGVVVAAAAGAGGTGPLIDYPDFSTTAGLTLNGSAAQSGSALRVVPNASTRHGSFWSQQQVDTSRSFESHFRARVHDGSVYPADGFTFTLQSQGLPALGDTGSAHGYSGSVATAVKPSVAVDVSLFPQLMNGLTERVGILTNGDMSKLLASAAAPVVLYSTAFDVWVDYDASSLVLSVFVGQSATKPSVPLVSTKLDLAGTVGADAYAGFTAATGVLHADFDVLGWQLDETADTTPPSVSCSADPSTLWPPNGKLVPTAVVVAVDDSGSGPAGFSLVSVRSNEGDVATESEGWAPDTPDTSGFLRASRLGTGSGRVYTLVYEGADKAGNRASCQLTVVVPHDQR